MRIPFKVRFANKNDAKAIKMLLTIFPSYVGNAARMVVYETRSSERYPIIKIRIFLTKNTIRIQKWPI